MSKSKFIQSERHFIWVTPSVGTQRFNPDLWKIELRALLVSRSQRHTRYPHVIIMDCSFIFLNNQLLHHNFEWSIALHFSNKMLDYFNIGLLNKPLHISAVVRLESPILDWTSRSSQEEPARPSRFRDVVRWHYITDKKSTWTRWYQSTCNVPLDCTQKRPIKVLEGWSDYFSIT